MQGMIHITVKLFGPAVEVVGESHIEYALAEPALAPPVATALGPAEAA